MSETKTMRIVKAVCRKCGNDVELNIGEMTLKEAEAATKKTIYNCIPGRHVELGPMADYLTIDWMSLGEKVDERPTDEQYGKDLVAKHGVENVFALGGEEIQKAVGVKSLHSVNDLTHIGQGEFADEEFFYSRYDAPHGSRFYVKSPR